MLPDWVAWTEGLSGLSSLESLSTRSQTSESRAESQLERTRAEGSQPRVSLRPACGPTCHIMPQENAGGISGLDVGRSTLILPFWQLFFCPNV